MEQPQYNMFERERFEKEFDLLYRELGYGTTIFSPLASGLLSGKYNNGIPEGSRASLEGFDWLRRYVITPERVSKVKQLSQVAQELGCSMAQLALAWCLKNPNVSTVITGASRAEQVHENMKALDVASQLNPVIMSQIESILGNNPNREEE
jgi:aryl-alcohol dehydrogenase-like predicted oxidoreductase